MPATQLRQILMIQVGKRGVCSLFMLAITAMACAPSGTQPPPRTIKAMKETSHSASTINNALAAMQSTLSAKDYQIGPEDLIQITLYNMPETGGRTTPRTVTLRVSLHGLISLPLIGELRAAGLTAAELEQELRSQYDQYIYNPQVGVAITEYRQRLSVIGAVQKPGIFELSGPRTIIDMLGMAGGVTEKAGTHVHVYRQGPNGRESHVIDLLFLASNAKLINADNANLTTMQVQAGDVINVPPAGTFFVDGAVRTPGLYALSRRYSLIQALAAAGGIDRELYSSDVTIFRRKDSSEMEVLSVNFDAISAGTEVDPLIEPDDVIVVPTSTAKFLVKRFVGQLIGGGISIGSFVGGS